MIETSSNNTPPSYLSRRYGRKSGIYRHYRALIELHLGFHRAYRDINWSLVKRVIFVCHGNICRSAYAAARFSKSDLHFESFGLQTTANKPAYETAIIVGNERGVDLANHRSKRVEDFAPQVGDLFVGMEAWHGQQLTDRFHKNYQVTLLGLWSTPVRPHLEDPYGLARDYFETCFDVIDSAVANMINKIRCSS